MANRRRRIARKAAANRHFLISQTDSRRIEEPSEIGLEQIREALRADFPDLLYGHRLQDEATECLNACRRFGVLVLRPDERRAAPEAEPSPADQDHWLTIAVQVDTFCHRIDAFWGIEDAGCLVIYVPDRAPPIAWSCSTACRKVFEFMRMELSPPAWPFTPRSIIRDRRPLKTPARPSSMPRFSARTAECSSTRSV